MRYEVELVSKFVEDGFMSHDLFGNEYPLAEDRVDALNQLKFVPQETLKNVYEKYNDIVTGEVKTVNTFLSVAAKKGLMKFKPYVAYDGAFPTLVLKYNRYVHLFGECYYQVSYTNNGIGEYQRAGVRLDVLRSNMDSNRLRHSDFMKAIYYMNCISACTGIDEFDNLLKKEPEVVDEFVAKSTRAAGVFDNYTMTFEKLKSYVLPIVVDNEKDMTGVDGNLYRVPVSLTTDYVRFAVNHGAGIVTFTWTGENAEVKSMQISTSLASSLKEAAESYKDEDERDDAIKEAEEVIHDDATIETFITFGLNLLGFVANYMVIYPKDKNIAKLRGLNDRSVVTIESLSDLYK